MNEQPAPLSWPLKLQASRVGYFAAKLYRCDDDKKVTRIKRQIRQATEDLIEMALADRADRLATTQEATDG